MFAREYQQQLFTNIDNNIYQISSGWFLEQYGPRYDIMCCHLTLAFLPFSDLSLRFIDTYFESLAMNLLCLVGLPINIFVTLVAFIFTGNMRLIADIFDSIFNIALTLIILKLEIASGLLSLVTKPLITLGFLVAYTADFMMNLFITPENAEHTNKQSDLAELDKLLLK